MSGGLVWMSTEQGPLPPFGLMGPYTNSLPVNLIHRSQTPFPLDRSRLLDPNDAHYISTPHPQEAPFPKNPFDLLDCLQICRLGFEETLSPLKTNTHDSPPPCARKPKLQHYTAHETRLRMAWWRRRRPASG